MVTSTTREVILKYYKKNNTAARKPLSQKLSMLIKKKKIRNFNRFFIKPKTNLLEICFGFYKEIY